MAAFLWIASVLLALTYVPPSLAQCPTECFCLDDNVFCTRGTLNHVPVNVSNATTQLDLSSNLIPFLDDRSFAGLTELRILKLSSNVIKYISSSTFRELRKLEVLHLHSNQLREIQPFTFEKLNNLRRLSLQGNLLEELDSRAFHGLSSLTILFLSDNKIQALPKKVIEPLTSLQTMLLSGNVLTCDCTAVWMQLFEPLHSPTTEPVVCAAPPTLVGRVIDEVPLQEFNCAVPELTVSEVKIQAFIGDSVELSCVATGDPAPEQEWLFEGRVLSDSLLYRLTPPSDLTILSLSPGLQGDYVCRATNVVGNTTSVVTVVSLGLRLPELLTSPVNMHAFVGESFTLHCRGNQYTMSYRWLRNGVLLSHSPPALTLEEGVGLTMLNASRSDSGVYTCEAVNTVGSASATATVTITGPVLTCYGVVDSDSIAELTQKVRNAVTTTVQSMMGGASPSPSRLLRRLNFPPSGVLEALTAAEVFQQALQLARTNISRAAGGVIPELTPCELAVLASLSGCQEHTQQANCSDVCRNQRYRTIDGTCNNIDEPLRGAAGAPFHRALPPAYEDLLSLPRGWSGGLPSARLVSRSLLSAPQVAGSVSHTLMLMQLGQFLDHDIDMAPSSASDIVFSSGQTCDTSCANEAPCFPIAVPPGDARISRPCLPFTRSAAVCGSGASSILVGAAPARREQINLITSFIDASMIYGSDDYKAQRIRDPSGGGRLLEGVPALSGGKPLLPFDTHSLVECSTGVHSGRSQCFLAGDARGNEQVALTAMHTLFMREHNRVAARLAALNPFWTDERLYQEARKVVAAEWQHIVFNEYLRRVLGPTGMASLGPYAGYDSSADPTISNVFATAAFRYGHSQIMPQFHRLDAGYVPAAEGPLALRDAFFAPFRLIEEGGVDPLLRGLLATPSKRRSADMAVSSNITEALFAQANDIALDLAALNIQRGRDHGLPDYTAWRDFCGLSQVSSYADVGRAVSDAAVVDGLRTLYGDDPSAIDLWVGGLLEEVVAGAELGPTFLCIIGRQFARLRDGDRFWFEREGQFSLDQVGQLRRASLSRLICDNADNITMVPPKALQLLPTSEFVPCTALPSVNLDLWTECSETSPVRGRRSALLGAGESWSDLSKRLEALEKSVAGTTARSHCVFNGAEFGDGSSWAQEPCLLCSCQLGEVSCSAIPGCSP